MNPIARGFAFFAMLGLAACAAAPPRPVHFASATEADLDRSKREEVWYEFRVGDEVPVAFLYVGVMEAKAPVRAVAKRPFWLVLRPNAPAELSFDGRTVAGSMGDAALGVAKIEDKNVIGVMVHIGKAEDAPPAMKK